MGQIVGLTFLIDQTLTTNGCAITAENIIPREGIKQHFIGRIVVILQPDIKHTTRECTD